MKDSYLYYRGKVLTQGIQWMDGTSFVVLHSRALTNGNFLDDLINEKYNTNRFYLVKDHFLIKDDFKVYKSLEYGIAIKFHDLSLVQEFDRIFKTA